MRKRILMLAVSGLMLAACNTSGSGQARADGTASLQPIAETLVGTLRLDGTDNAVTREQAAELLPMWQVYQQLLTSDTAAQAEIEGLAQQIQESLTDQQRQAISDMQLTQADEFALLRQQSSSSSTGSSQRANGGSGQSSGTFQGGGFPGGGFEGGGPPGGFGGPPDGGFGPEGGFAGGTQTSGTSRASAQQARGSLDRLPAALLNAMIEYLKAKAAA